MITQDQVLNLLSKLGNTQQDIDDMNLDFAIGVCVDGIKFLEEIDTQATQPLTDQEMQWHQEVVAKLNADDYSAFDELNAIFARPDLYKSWLGIIESNFKDVALKYIDRLPKEKQAEWFKEVSEVEEAGELLSAVAEISTLAKEEQEEAVNTMVASMQLEDDSVNVSTV